MKASGPKHERETIIQFDEENETASIWTTSQPVYTRLLKRGFKPTEDGERHAIFNFDKKAFRLPVKPRKLSQAQKESLARARAVATGSQEQKEAISEADRMPAL